MDRRTLLTTAVALTTAATTAACSGGSRGATTTPATRTPTTTRTSARPPRPADWTALARGLDGKLIRPGDADYRSARQLYNTRFDGQKPAAVAYVADEDDIKECLAYAKAHGTPVSIRNGGHSYGGWSSGNGRLVIDVSSLNRVGADGVIGAGAKLVDVYRTLARRGRTVPAGSCPTVGISGLTLGGGHGVTSRAYGLTCDSLTEATLVTADGRTLTASATENKDLFWALRGGGNGNFGVVTRFRFRTHPAPPTVSAFLTWPWPRAAAVIAAWQRWAPDQPDEIWSSLHLAAGPGGVRPTLSVAAFTLGRESDLRNALDRLADAAGSPASSAALRPRGYLDAMLAYAGCLSLPAAQCRLPGTTPGRDPRGALPRETYAAASDFFDRDLAPAGRQALIAAAEAFTRIPANRGGGGSIALTALGGAVNRVDPLATSFVHRRSRMLAQYIAAWQPGTAGTAQQSWLKDAHASMRRYASGAAYQNYADPNLKNWRQAYYGPAADRLTRLKRQYDPDRVFAYPQAL
ncbi:FAD-binding oxidoreductase [Streptomyces sp. ISL-10]|uniref:FAD-binding oxidoreductase n=1 Tax=Streptomyces sp. ISL-10 TaxID=2819172 RepID=UPI001BE9EB03|nr:FAD-binding oxidoreductase [Streptomyces sp. ISL-10]MBT2364908.1 FAD-binding oxidoreductase [Streptomyces sp. ISL-10]